MPTYSSASPQHNLAPRRSLCSTILRRVGLLRSCLLQPFNARKPLKRWINSLRSILRFLRLKQIIKHEVLYGTRGKYFSCSSQPSSNGRRVSWGVCRRSRYKRIHMHGTYHGQFKVSIHLPNRRRWPRVPPAVRSTHASLAAAR